MTLLLVSPLLRCFAMRLANCAPSAAVGTAASLRQGQRNCISGSEANFGRVNTAILSPSVQCCAHLAETNTTSGLLPASLQFWAHQQGRIALWCVVAVGRPREVRSKEHCCAVPRKKSTRRRIKNMPSETFASATRNKHCPATKRQSITVFTSYRTNLSPFTKGCRERDTSM